MNSPRTEIVLDLRSVPRMAKGHHSLLWWGTIGFMLIEGFAFVLAIATYFYLETRVPVWPPGLAAPDPFWGTINTVVMLASIAPNAWTKLQANRENLWKSRIGLIVCLVFGIAFSIIRLVEFEHLNCRWDSNAYGSIVWALLGLHTLHLWTDVGDSIVLAAAMFDKPDPSRFVDVSENAVYWYFVVVAWLPLYAVIYLYPLYG
jgi:heme/copper-type cytochrome/quinol oxidase subunit 3